MPIIENGRTRYQIVTPGRRFPVENEAARQLQKAFIEMTGARVPVRWGDRRTPKIPTIWLGETAATEPGFRDPDSYSIEPDGDDLRLTGKFRRGVHYAVAAFLESLGVGFYAPEVVHYPSLDRVELPDHSTRSESAFTYRNVFYPDTEIPEWAMKLKINVHHGGDRRWGPNAMAQSIGHSFAGLVPTDRYFDDHPEYFSLVDGLRRRERPQLCCTNPEVADAAAETMARWIQDLPDKRIFAVAQNDWHNWCECPECSAVDEREGTHMGQVLTLVNRIAERFPDRMFATLAYQWTVDPPKLMRAADNVLIVLCHNRGCYYHGIDQCSLNDKFLERLKGWSEQDANILIWDYYVNYRHYLLPTPNFRRIGNDIKLYSGLGIKAMFCQGSACTGGQFEHLRQFVQAKLLWDPGLDVEKLMVEWAEGVLGKQSAAPVLEYLFTLEDRVQKEDIHMTRYSQRLTPELFNPDFLVKGAELWDTAEERADSPERARRIFALRSAEMAGRLLHADGRYVVEGGGQRAGEGALSGAQLVLKPPVDKPLVDRFVDACIEANVSYLREDKGAPEDFRFDYGRTYKAVVLENPEIRAVVLPEIGGRMYSLKLKADSREVLKVPQIYENINSAPYGDGYEFVLEHLRLGKGAVEEYEVTARDDGSVTVEAVLEDDMMIRTEYRVAAFELQITHTVKNLSDTAASFEPMMNPSWDRLLFGDDSTIVIGLEDGGEREFPLNPEGRDARDVFFQDADRPAGTWSIMNGPGDLRIRASFAPDSIAHTRAVFNNRSECIQMRHCYPKIELAPGAEATYESTWLFETE